MNNESAGLGNAGNLAHLLGILLIAFFLRLGYELSRPRPATNKNPSLSLPDNTELSLPEKEWVELQPWQRKASEKAVERYAAAQEKKWRQWNEAMFERSA